MQALLWGVLAARDLDALKNLTLIEILAVGATDGRARLAWSCAGSKFSPVLLAVAYVLVWIGALS